MSHLDYEINKELGECYLFMGEMDKAHEYYTKAAGSNGVHADPYLGLATVAVHRGQLDEAYSLYLKASSLDETEKALTGLGLVEIELGKVEDAHGHFNQALDKNPGNMIALLGIVQSGYVLSKVDEVISRLSLCLDEDPLKHDIRFTLAGCLVNNNRKQEACGHLERILEHEPEYQAAKELIASLESDSI